MSGVKAIRSKEDSCPNGENKKEYILWQKECKQIIRDANMFKNCKANN